jgi:hypothetical protein
MSSRYLREETGVPDIGFVEAHPGKQLSSYRQTELAVSQINCPLISLSLPSFLFFPSTESFRPTANPSQRNFKMPKMVWTAEADAQVRLSLSLR